MPLRIHHVDLPMGDPQLVEEFYKAVFGWIPSAKLFRTINGWSDTPADAPQGVLLEHALNDGSYITFISTKQPEYSEDEPHIALLVTPRKLEAVHSSLERLGLNYEENEENPSFYDPSNLRVELYATQKTGGAI
ncbi:MAG: VOC family protein [Candidatus Marsarchaeota archaeon]|nr:VOC family protein [Candidatus Marsarchaeota archaeon]